MKRYRWSSPFHPGCAIHFAVPYQNIYIYSITQVSRRGLAAKPVRGRESPGLVVQELDHRCGLLTQHDPPDDGHVGPPVLLGGAGVSRLDHFEEPPLGTQPAS